MEASMDEADVAAGWLNNIVIKNPEQRRISLFGITS
jgi:hypothetical protein